MNSSNRGFTFSLLILLNLNALLPPVDLCSMPDFLSAQGNPYSTPYADNQQYYHQYPPYPPAPPPANSGPPYGWIAFGAVLALVGSKASCPPHASSWLYYLTLCRDWKVMQKISAGWQMISAHDDQARTSHLALLGLKHVQARESFRSKNHM